MPIDSTEVSTPLSHTAAVSGCDVIVTSDLGGAVIRQGSFRYIRFRYRAMHGLMSLRTDGK